MAVTEADRRDVFIHLEEVHGERIANLLMELLPLHPNDELATRTDVLATATVLRGEMAELRGELRGEMTELRAELRGEMTELRGEMAELRAELRGEMVGLKAELRGEMAELRADVRTEIAGLQRWGAGILAANAVAVVTALLT